MRIIVDRAACDGNGLCARAAPGLIAMDDDDEPVILAATLDEDQLADARAAVAACPKAARASGD